MAEIILGVGVQKSVRNVMAIVENQVRKAQGIPRTLICRAAAVEIIAKRPDFNVPFDTYILRAKATDPLLSKLKAAAQECGPSCSATQDGEWLALRCAPATATPTGTDAPDGAAALEAALEAADKLSTVLPLPQVWRVVGDDFRIDALSSELLFKAMIQYKASDLHLCPGQTPVFRVDSQTRSSELFGPMSALQIRALIREIASDRDWTEFEEHWQTSFNFHQAGLGYSRVSAFVKAGMPHCTLRFLPEVIPSFEELNVPRKTMESLSNLHHGLVLVTGMTGSGKSTTVAAMVDWINSTKALHILTIENPVEYVHLNKKSMISQRNVGTDIGTFNEAVTGALRHDPNVIVIGEMRDSDTIRSAINAAATGHLVISTLHSNTASEVINRIISFFDPVERDLVRLQLRDCIRCIICQRLVPRIGGGRIPAIEILFNDIKPINDGISAGDTDGIRIGMQQTVSHSFLFEEYLHRLVKDKRISLELARTYATEQSVLDQMVMGTYSVPRLDTIRAARSEGR